MKLIDAVIGLLFAVVLGLMGGVMAKDHPKFTNRIAVEQGSPANHVELP